MLRSLVRLTLPGGRRQHAGPFVFQIDAGKLAKAERLHEVMNRIDTEVIGQDVVVGITGDDDRLVHVDETMAADLVVAEPVVAEPEKAWIADRHRRRPFA